jgi:hypothetical protein
MKNFLAFAVTTVHRLMSLYPVDRMVKPFRSVLLARIDDKKYSSESERIAVQVVEAPFYYGLLGLMAAEIRRQSDYSSDAVVIRASSGAIGMGWAAWIRRSILINWLMTSQWVRALHPVIARVGLRCESWAHPINDSIDAWRSRKIWQHIRQQEGDLHLIIDGVQVGDLVIDSYLRFRPSPKFNVDDPFVLQLIRQTHRSVRRARRYFSEYKPKLYLTSYSTYIEHGVPVRVALQEGVRVYSFGSLNLFDKRLTIVDSYHSVNCEQYAEIFASLSEHERRRTEAETQLRIRLSGGIDPATSYMKTSAYAGVEANIPEGLDGAAVIFLHDFYDSPHVYPDLLFSDFWRWAVFTIDTLDKAGIKYFLKPHPNQIALSGSALEDLLKIYPSARILLSTVTNTQLAKAGIACGVTAYGTVAHELAYLGVPTIACARHPHTAFEFCRTARNLSEYVELISGANTMPIDPQHMRMQALEFYYMHNLYGSPEDLELRQQFVGLWRECQDPLSDVISAQSKLAALRDSPAFANRMSRILKDS